MTSSTHSSDKHSPHTSPRFSRRSTTPSLMAVQNDLYAGHIPTLSLAGQPQQQQQQAATANYISAASVLSSGGGVGGGMVHQPPPSAPPMNVVNGGSTVQLQAATAPPTANNSSTPQSSSSAATVVVVASQKSTNRMSAPLMGTNSVIVTGYGNKIGNKTDICNDNSNSSYAILQNLQESQAIVSKEAQKREATCVALAATGSAPSSAPPLPPRKSSPGADNVNVTSPTNGPMNGGGAMQKIVMPQTSKSVDNIAATLGEICVPKTTAPPIPPHNSSHVDSLVDEMRAQRLTTTATSLVATTLATTTTTNLLDDDIVGPAETIMGVIDTRPLEARSTIIGNYTHLCSNTTTGSNNTITTLASSSSTSSSSNTNCNNNLRNDLKITSNETTTTAAATPNNRTIANLQQQQHHPHNNHHQQQHHQQPLLYENISINQKVVVGDCTVPYENINLEYIARLMNEGYSKENAITALGISRNNIEMACDILREFVAKNSV
ncbi:mucin-5AC-like [Musca vetustissima]|uniref:mucin-5AC-like n=1 Tax=Musca vetustissima TaxID=27455 RepID=UPI002AB7342B|nr:mucin-5AC-like [Musca vetustissima]